MNFVCVSFFDFIFIIDFLKVCRGFFFVVVMEDGELGLRFVGVVMS